MCVPRLSASPPSPLAPGSGGLRRTLDAQWVAGRRARWVRGAAINAAVLLLLSADLCCKCAEYTGLLHWVEAAAAGVAGANLLRLALALLRLPAPPPAPAQHAQRRRRGLSHSDYDSSFVEDDSITALSDSSVVSAEEAHTPLSARREWRARGGGGAGGGAAGGGGGGSPPGDSPPPERPQPDQFIADRRDLANYLQEYSLRSRSADAGEGGAGGGAGVSCRAPPPAYQLAAAEPAGAAGGAGGEEGGELALHAAWGRLHLDPQRLTQFNLNLRLWLHVTILERLVREMAAAEAALARAGLGALGELGAERLRALARAPAAPPALGRLLPFLEPWADRRYAVRRIRELARGGCLGDYRWNGGGAGWEPSEPTDAELVLQLFAAYMDAQLPGAPGTRPFSAEHVSAAPAPAARALAVHRVALRPPHYVLAWRGETLEVARGRNNLLHTLLVFIAAAARAEPPALRRLHLGPAGLNVLWIIGR